MTKPLNQSGAAHLFIAAIVVVGIAAVGTYAVVRSKASTYPPPPEYLASTAGLRSLANNEQANKNADTAAKQTAGFNLKVATYNILGTGAKNADDFNREKQVSSTARTKMAAKIIADNDYDIVGLQEVDHVGKQFQTLKAALAARGYGLHPNKISGDERRWMRPIAYKKARVQITAEKGFVRYPWQDAPNFAANDAGNWARFTVNGKKLYFYNVHLVAFNTSYCRYTCNPPGSPGGSDAGGAQKRREAAKLIAASIRKKKNANPDATFILTGDFNSGFTKNSENDRAVTVKELPYRILQPVIPNTFDLASGKRGPTNGRDGNRSALIDQIYMTDNHYTVGARGPIPYVTPAARKASDHFPVSVWLTAR